MIIQENITPQKSRLKHVMITMSNAVLNRSDPLGARCIMGAIETTGHEVGLLLEDRLEERSTIIDKVIAFDPAIVWISIQPSTTGIVEFLTDLSHAVDCPFIIGNVGARAMLAPEMSQINEFSLIVIGQGEDTTVELIKYFERNGRQMDVAQLRKIPNLRWLESGKIIETPSVPSTLAKNLIPSHKDLHLAVARGDIIAARSSSGCNASCTFCTVRAINNGQRWKGNGPLALVEWLTRIVEAGKIDGSIAMTDDDLAGDIENLENVAMAFAAVNGRFNSDLKFSFSTRAAHLVSPKDTPEMAAHRRDVWHQAVKAGLQAVFLGLESGSSKQLKRIGKGSTADTNYKAVDFADSLGIRVEVGFIPIDPLMDEESWREEMIENVQLARHCRVAETSPTWLAPMRAYRDSPLARWLEKKSLLGPLIPETEEFIVRYQCKEVVEFMQDLGPALCEGRTNGYYRFKREFKALQRYRTPVFKYCWQLGEAIIGRELVFVENLINADSPEEIRQVQQDFADEVITHLNALIDTLTPEAGHNNYARLICKWSKNAITTFQEWIQETLLNPDWQYSYSEHVDVSQLRSEAYAFEETIYEEEEELDQPASVAYASEQSTVYLGRLEQR